jgi:glycosyltransferase involved in cell wall biosynthesis
MRFKSTLFVTNHTFHYSGMVHEFFREHSDEYRVFVHSATHSPEDSLLETYTDGRRTSSESIPSYRGRIGVLWMIMTYLDFLRIAYFRVPRGTVIITYHPLFCFGNAFLRRLRGIRTVLWLYDHYPNRFPTMTSIAGYYARRMSEMLFVTDAMRDSIVRDYPPPVGARRETVEMALRAAPYHRAPERGRIGYIGGFDGSQNVELAIRALALDHELRLDLVGDSSRRGELEGLARTLGVGDRVHFFGRIFDESRLADIAARWEAGVAPYQTADHTPYGDPSKLKSYWQLGLPVVISSAQPRSREVLAWGVGEVCELDPRSFVLAVERVCAKGPGYQANIETLRARYDYRTYLRDRLSFLAEPAL